MRGLSQKRTPRNLWASSENRSTPWGMGRTSETFAEGFTSVSTPGHGGFMVSKQFATQHLSPECIAYGTKHGDYICFEEDCDWAMPAWELPQFWPQIFAYMDESAKADPRAYLLHTLSVWRAEYLLARGIPPEPEGYADYLARREADAMRDRHDSDLIVSAYGDWYTHDSGVNEVITADGKHHRVTADSYDCRRVPNRLSDCVAA